MPDRISRSQNQNIFVPRVPSLTDVANSLGRRDIVGLAQTWDAQMEEWRKQLMAQLEKIRSSGASWDSLSGRPTCFPACDHEHTQYVTVSQMNAAISGGDSSVFQLRSERSQANGYAPLDNNALLPLTFLPAHATTHQSGGTDAIKLDDLAAPDDNVDLNASTTKHGLMPKGTGSTATFFRSDMTQAAPPTSPPGGAVGEVQFHQSGGVFDGSENITVVGSGIAEVLTLLKHLNVTNQKTAGASGENPTKIITGGPNTKGLRIEGTELTSGTPWTPAQLSSSVLLLWLDLSQESGFVDGDPIGQWDDFSGNNNDGTASGVDRPTYETNEINGYPVARFDGVNDRSLLNSQINLGTTDFNIIGVGTRSTSTRFIPAGHVSGGNYGGSLIWDDNVIYSSMDDGSAYSAAYTGSNGDILFHFRRAGTTHYFVGGGMAETTLPNTFGSSQSLSIRALQISSVRSAFGIGDIAELIILSSSATQADREKVRGYIAWKHGLQAQIPTGDPYESARPEIATPPASNLVEVGRITGETQLTVASRGQVTVATHTATDVALTLQAAAAQTTALQQFRDSGGTLLYELLPVARPTYTFTNVTPDRSVDCNLTTVDELADAFGTLVSDLRALGIIA